MRNAFFSPGKLFLSGEYAITKPGNSSILVPTDRGVTLSITRSHSLTGRIINSSKKLPSGTWTKNSKAIVVSNPFFDKIGQLIETVNNYLDDSLPIFDITITTTLNDEATGIKYGLGSSGAIQAALLQGINEIFMLNLSKIQQFKLIAISQLTNGISGSQADIATSVYNKPIIYQNYNHEVIEEKINSSSINQILHHSWENLKITPFEFPTDWHLIIGWTKEPASTNALLQKLKISELSKDFFDNTDYLTKNLIFALKHRDIEQTKKLTSLLQKNYQVINEKFKINPVTQKLLAIQEIGKSLKIPAKTSGSGFGDNGYLIVDNNADLSKVKILFKKLDIQSI